MVSVSPIASMVTDTAVVNSAKLRECGSKARVNRPPAEDATMRVIMGTIHTGLSLERSRAVSPEVIADTSPNAMMQERQQLVHHKPHKT